MPGMCGMMGLPPVATSTWSAVYSFSPTRTRLGPVKRATYLFIGVCWEGLVFVGGGGGLIMAWWCLSVGFIYHDMDERDDRIPSLSWGESIDPSTDPTHAPPTL